MTTRRGFLLVLVVIASCAGCTMTAASAKQASKACDALYSVHLPEAQSHADAAASADSHWAPLAQELRSNQQDVALRFCHRNVDGVLPVTGVLILGMAALAGAVGSTLLAVRRSRPSLRDAAAFVCLGLGVALVLADLP